METLLDIIQGYNGGTHQGDSRFGLDIVLADQPTSGAPILSPLDGSVAWAFDPGDKTGCIEVVQPERTFGVMLCHVLLDRPYSRGERVVVARCSAPLAPRARSATTAPRTCTSSCTRAVAAAIRSRSARPMAG